MKYTVLLLLLSGGLFATEPERLNIFGRIKRNVKVATTRTFNVFQRVTPRIAFGAQEKQFVDNLRKSKESKARFGE